MTYQQIINRLGGRDMFMGAIWGALAKTAAQGVDMARVYSSGPFSSAELARMGHPYARAHPAPPAPTGIINRQSGVFYNAWHVEQVPGGLAVVNDSPHADFMYGTVLMVERPVWQLVADYMESQAGDNIRAALEDLLR